MIAAAFGSPGVSVAVNGTDPSATVVVSTVMLKTGPVAPAAGLKVLPPPASEMLLTPEAARAETWTVMVPPTGSVAALPGTPRMLIDPVAVLVPATHLPELHTG